MIDRFLGALVEFFASLRLTVVCLAFAIVLVFAGTLAQVPLGLYAAQQEYFRSFFVFWQPSGMALKVPVLPGGYLVGGVLLLNLITAFFTRYSFTKRHFGIVLIHAGLVLLLLGQLLTDMLSVESAMQLSEGETKNYSEDFRANEVFIVDKSDTSGDMVHSVQEHLLVRKGGVAVAGLPFQFRVVSHWENAGLVRPGTKEAEEHNAVHSGATAGGLKDILVIPQSKVADMDRRNTPAMVLALSNENGPVGKFLLSSLAANPQEFRDGGKSYEIGMRLTRYYYPFSITLLKATHDKYKGTEIPKNFSSRVRIDNRANGESRETVIYMNNPLRYGGQTFYQYQMSAGEMARRQGMTPSSTFQVVRNPGWLTPYVSTVLMSLGLMVQFSYHLVGFVRRKGI
jgi:hypothetical protein